MIRNLICSLPLCIKEVLGSAKTMVDIKKRKQIRTISKYQSKRFPTLNDMQYKKKLRRFLSLSALSSAETEEYICKLYNNNIELINDVEFNKDIPTIICVVKNEADKLEAFFEHYRRIGFFNYIFIDNESTDRSADIIKKNGGKIFLCHEKFSTNKKMTWINNVFSTLPENAWVILLDADELLVYDSYETRTVNDIIDDFEKNKISISGAVMIDMFSNHPCNKSDYLKNYIYFENSFHLEKSFYFNSIYGGIREREFKMNENRIFLIKKHPIVKKTDDVMLIHPHYVFPYEKNFKSEVYFGLLHYKLFDNEIEKYKKIAEQGGYGNGSIEYRTYLKKFTEKTYEDIFTISKDTVLYEGTPSLKNITCLRDVEELNNAL